ncbi:macrolide family glycosyltransferase [Dactylosporangium siamense]|uniref:Glycosyl transferase n=1 Tax=Dactylosporangium siamense TaxID=685454 RepID=A0A919PYB8_9ACTN|nr:macrolide family glycosyltransferase [Dactylosporangium siamense]GIG52594.1 glycosyl transferase [Dactylosporangium siamense]
MAHIAFFAPPSAGHLNPTLGLAAELLRRGHRVTYATTHDYTDRVGEVSSAVVEYTEQHPGDFRSFQFTGRSLVDAMSASLAETEALLPVLRGAFPVPPDVVVYDNAAWWGRLLAAEWKTPAVQVSPMFVSNDQWSMSERYTKLSLFQPRLWLFLAKLGGFLRKVGTDITPKQLLTGDGADRRVVFIPREFQFRGETFDDTYRFVGPCLFERRFLGTWERTDERRPLILVTLGTIYNQNPQFFRTCMDAVADLGGHVVIAVGDGVDLDALGTPPPNVELRRFVAQLHVLEHADLFITHAGMGSTMEALYHGVPMLAVPQMAEEQANADRIAEVGAGRVVATAGLTAPALRAEIERMLADTAIRRRARELRDATRAAGGADAAADSVEAALHAAEHLEERATS